MKSSASQRIGVLKESRIQGGLVGMRPAAEEQRALRRQISSGEIAAAISQLVEQHTNDLGVVDFARLGKKLGPKAAPFLAALRQTAKDGTRDRGGSEQKLGVYSDYSFIARVGMLRRPSEEMHAFWNVVQRTRHDRPLDKVELFSVQHLFSSTAELVKGLVAAGVVPYSVHLMGKPYSTNRIIHETMQADGFLHSVIVGSTTANANRAVANLRHAIEALPPGRRMLVLDDGGELLKAINEQLPEELAKRVIGVEQTTRGVTVLSDQKLKFPVVNVARSDAKVGSEAPLIGRAITKALTKKLTDLDRLDRGKSILIVGYGTVGRAVARRLRQEGYTNIVVHDPSSEARAAAAEDGNTAYAKLEDALPHGHVILGLTGQKDVVTPENAELLPEGAVLLNGASRATEFSGKLMSYAKRSVQFDQQLRNRFGKLTIRTGAAFDPARKDAVLRLPSGKEILLAASGHVINFTGEATDPIPPRYIQLTSGLLYLGALQASRTHEPGMHTLETAPQTELLDEVTQQLAKTGESLQNPSF